MSHYQPIAIIGLACRLPGCSDASDYWNLLCEGRDAISQTPQERWNGRKFFRPGESKPGKTQSQWGGFVDNIDRFDAALFGISPREAAAMDPQQRMLLEVAYRAAEDAGVPLDAMRGENVSVHVGISSFDYAVANLSFRDRGVIGPYSNTGGSSSIAANRISYCFDLRGESVAVDTACSSSLIATHLACQTLQDQHHKLAFAGGVNALLLPDFSVAFSQLGVLSPTGRCRTFDASADGYVRSEGAGMVLLKRLDDALADGDSIYAVIHGSATNQDGRTDGMTVPNAAAQQALIQSTLRVAGLQAEQISYVEAHGTGTPVGDPLEASAISQCYAAQNGVSRGVGEDEYRALGGGAGIASVIKLAMALKHRTVPAHLHLQTPHPDIDFPAFGLRVPTATEAWHAAGKRFGAINGLGYGGANAHLILGEAPAVKPTDGSTGIKLLTVSAHSASAFAETAGIVADWLEGDDASLEATAAAAALTRTHHPYRAAVTGESREAWVESLREIARADSHTPRAKQPCDLALAFVFCGQGPQWWAMGRGLLDPVKSTDG